ncbi:MAG: triose-phosphate isomerase, partial [Planctomycetota bacterium]
MKPFFAGNWKMYHDIQSSILFLDALLKRQEKLQTVDIGLFPPFPFLGIFQQKLRGTPFLYGAQNMHWEEKGAFTGEVSALHLKDFGSTHVILGHSERRQLFKETDEEINRKIFSAQQHGICPIFCVGETLQEREKGQTQTVIERQLR